MPAQLIADATMVVGEFIANAPINKDESENSSLARSSLIDSSLAFGLGAAREPSSLFLGLSRDGEHGVELCGVRLSAAPVMATMAFASVARSLELDDWAVYGAAGSSLWGALLCLARDEGVTDESRLLDAWVVGVRVGVALWKAGRYRQSDRGFDGTDVFGSIACAAAGARLLQLDVVQSTSAVAIAASEMGGIIANLGTDVGVLHAGFAARNGYQATRLARAGYYGAVDVLEARQGFGEAVFGPADGPLFGMSEALAASSRLNEYLRFRRYPCAIEHQRVISTVNSLAGSHSFPVTGIKSIRVEGVPPTSEGTRSDVPATSGEARRSLHYVLACLLSEGTISLSQFVSPSPIDERMAALLGRVEVDILPRWDVRLLQDDPADASLVLVTLPTGEVVASDPMDANTSLTEVELLEKWEAISRDLEETPNLAWVRQTIGAWRSSTDAEEKFSILRDVLSV